MEHRDPQMYIELMEEEEKKNEDNYNLIEFIQSKSMFPLLSNTLISFINESYTSNNNHVSQTTIYPSINNVDISSNSTMTMDNGAIAYEKDRLEAIKQLQLNSIKRGDTWNNQEEENNNNDNYNDDKDDSYDHLYDSPPLFDDDDSDDNDNDYNDSLNFSKRSLASIHEDICNYDTYGSLHFKRYKPAFSNF